MMSRITVYFGLWCALLLMDATGGVSQERSFPYQALVNTEKGLVYSGPGRVHYPTDELSRDAVVEVHRHDPDGWCAIRPPNDSFSLIPQTAIEMIADGVGSIVEDGIQAWVGTRLGAVDQPLWQVKLRKNERVRVLGEVGWPNAEGYSTLWYQIAPPAGEFRWIQIADLKLPKQAVDLPTDISDENFAGRISTSIADRDDADGHGSELMTFQDKDPFFSEKIQPPSERNNVVNQGWRQARTPIRIAHRDNANVPQEPFKIPAVASPSRVEPFDIGDSRPTSSAFHELDSRDGFVQGLTDVNSVGLAAMAPMSGPVSQRIQRLDTSLTAEILKPPIEWNLEPLLRQATLVSTDSSDANERQQAVRLIQKIRNAVALQSKYQTAYDSSSIDQNLVGTVGTGISSPVALGTTYDAHGWLKQLVRNKGAMQPTYVIENEQGKIVFQIAPAPGLNLNRYLNSNVGVIGRRGYNPELELDHITAERIVVLEQLRR